MSMVLKSKVTHILIRRVEDAGSLTEGKPCDDGGRHRSDAATAKGCLKPPEAARSEGFFPRASTGPWLSQHLHFGLPASRTTREHMSVV